MKGPELLAHSSPPHATRGSAATAPVRSRRRRRSGGLFSWLKEVLRFSGALDVGWTPLTIGFFLYLFVITSYRLNVASLAITLAVVGLPFDKYRMRFPLLVGLFFVYVGWAALGLWATRYPEIASVALTDTFKLALIFLVAVNVVKTEPRARFFAIATVALFGAFPARGAIINYVFYDNTWWGRAIWSGVYSNPNDLAALSFLPLALAIGLLVTEREKVIRIGAAAAVVVIPIVVLMTQSRGAFIGLAFLGISALITQRRRRIQTALRVGLVLAVVIAVAPADVWDRLAGLRNLGIMGGEKVVSASGRSLAVDEEGSATNRVEIMQIAIQITADHPMIGVGIGTYPRYHRLYAPHMWYRDAHSTYLTLAAETGIPGLLLVLGCVGVALGRSRKTRRQIRLTLPHRARQLQLLEIGLVAFMIAGIWGSYSKLAFLYLHLALLWGMATAYLNGYQRLRRANSQPTANDNPKLQ